MDFRDCVLTGRLSLNLWPYPKSFDAGILNPLGHNGSNPQKDGPRLDLEFATYDHPVIFPPSRIVKELVAHINRWGGQQRPVRAFKEISNEEMKLFEKITSRDALHEMSEQEKDFIWSIQNFCVTVPESLPRLLDSVKWASRAEVAQILVLLEQWKEVHPRVALELLDIKYPDRRVREFAVRCLNARLSDEQLCLYMISLVQALKYEPFMDCALVRYLLKRALMNQRMGHQFFWLMRF